MGLLKDNSMKHKPCPICQHPDEDSEEHWEMQCTRAEPYIWTTQNGRVIPVPELDDDHLKNIFNMIRGKERFNFGIFSEMVERKLWDADQGVLARYELRHHSAPRTLNGTIVPGFQEVCDHEGACACQKVHETLGL